MAYNEEELQNLHHALTGHPGISERKMFGGVCLMLDGNMLCGVGKNEAMFRVGKELEGEALAIEGVRPLSFTGRKMGGMVEIPYAEITETNRHATLALALEFVSSLPPK